MRILAEDGHAGGGVFRVKPVCTEIIIRAMRTRDALDEKGRRIRERTSVVQKRREISGSCVELFVEEVENRASCAKA